MKITSAHKKLEIPLAVFVLSCALYVSLLGSAWFFVAIPSMVGSLVMLLAFNIDRIVKFVSGWANRDGWK